MKLPGPLMELRMPGFCNGLGIIEDSPNGRRLTDDSFSDLFGIPCGGRYRHGRLHPVRDWD